MKINNHLFDSQVQVPNENIHIPLDFNKEEISFETELQNEVPIITVDKKFDPTSENPQSGKAVQEAIEKVNQNNEDNVKFTEQILTEQQKRQVKDNIDAANKQHLHWIKPTGEVTKPDITVTSNVAKAIDSISMNSPNLQTTYNKDSQQVSLNFIKGDIITSEKKYLTSVSASLDSPPEFVGSVCQTSNEPILELPSMTGGSFRVKAPFKIKKQETVKKKEPLANKSTLICQDTMDQNQEKEPAELDVPPQQLKRSYLIISEN